MFLKKEDCDFFFWLNLISKAGLVYGESIYVTGYLSLRNTCYLTLNDCSVALNSVSQRWDVEIMTEQLQDRHKQSSPFKPG